MQSATAIKLMHLSTDCYKTVATVAFSHCIITPGYSLTKALSVIRKDNHLNRAF
jgi:hypothetical protein